MKSALHGRSRCPCARIGFLLLVLTASLVLPQCQADSDREAARPDPSPSETGDAVTEPEPQGFDNTPPPTPADRPDTPPALAELRRCIDDNRAASCRGALTIGLSPLFAARAWTFLGLNLQRTSGDTGTADGPVEKAYREAIRVRPEFPLAHFLLGLRFEHVRPHAAVTELETALRLRPDWHPAREVLARILANDRRWDRVATLQREVLRSRPDDPRTQQELARTLIAAERWGEAVPLLQAVCRSSLATTERWTDLGNALAKLSRKAEAIDAYRHAVTAPGEDATEGNRRVILSWAVNGMEQLGDMKAAIAARQRWLDTDAGLRPESITQDILDGQVGEWYRDLHAGLAADFERLGRPVEAQRAREALLAPYRQAVARAASRATVHDSLAEALDAAGRKDEAIAETREAVRLEPSQASWHRKLSFRLSAAGRLEEALEAARRWHTLDAKNAEAVTSEARLLMQLKRDDEALDLLRRASDGPQADEAIVNTLTMALESRGKVADVLFWVRRSFEMAQGVRFGYSYNVPGWNRDSARRAADMYRSMALRAPNDPAPECALGRTLAEVDGKSTESLEAYRRCAAKGPRLAWAHAQLGLRLLELGFAREALQALEAAEKIEAGFVQKRYGYKNALEQCRTLLKKEGEQ